MSRIFIFLFSSLFFVQLTLAQTKTWNGGAVDDYQDGTKWLPAGVPGAGDVLVFNTAGSVIVANVPNTSVQAININGTSSVTFLTNLSTNVLNLTAATPLIYTTPGTVLAGDLLTISLGTAASFTMSSGTFGIAPSSGGKVVINGALTLAGGTLDFDVVGSGGTIINGSITNISGTFNSANVSALAWYNGSNYNHAVTGSAASVIPISYWAPGSNCNITGMNGGTLAPTGFTNVPFANFAWNCPSQLGNVDLNFAGLPVNINGALTITSTGAASNALRLTGAGASVINVAGNYSQTGGIFVLQSSTGSTSLNITGNVAHSAGTIDFVGTGSAGGSATLNVQGNLVKSFPSSVWSSTSNNTASKMTIQFSGASSQVVTIASFWNNPAGGTCNIVNTNTSGVGVSLNSGSLRVANVGSATPASCNNSGRFTGAGSFIYTGTTSLQYTGTIPQTASAVEFPVLNGPLNLVINNTAGVSFPASPFDRTITGNLSMASGNLSVGTGSTLSLTNSVLANQLTYAAGFITSGSLARSYPAAGLPTSASVNSRFPFGTGINDRSINIIFSAAGITTGGIITISHAAIVNATDITGVMDNGVNIDRITNSNWTFSTGAVNLGAATISVTAQANNIGAVTDVSRLRLTDNAPTAPGVLIPSSGTPEAPLVGRSNLSLVDINSKTFYVGSDKAINPLQIVTYIWTGVNGTAWTDNLNWAPNTGYPSSQTEIAIINNTAVNIPVITTGIPIDVYQLTVGAAATLSMTGSANLSVYDVVVFTGTALFSGTSTFTYANPNFAASQNIIGLPYVNLGITGLADKIMPATTTVTGNFTINGTLPTFGTGTFIYDAGTIAIQRIAAANYYNLTIAGNRGGRTIRLGNGVSNNIIDVANNFTVTATNYIATPDAYNTVNFSKIGTLLQPQIIPGFTYGGITNIVSAPPAYRQYDPLGSTNAANVIICKSIQPPGPSYVRANNIVTGSKIILNRDQTIATGNTVISVFYYNDFEITGNFGGRTLGITSNNTIGIAGTFVISATNFVQANVNNNNTFDFNGIGTQTIPGFQTVGATPAWKYNNLLVSNNNREVILDPVATRTINITGKFTAPASFTVGNGFTVTGSTVNFVTGSNDIPVLIPKTGTNNYNNVTITSGVRILTGDMAFGGDLNIIGSDAEPAQLNIGGSSAANRTLNVLGNLNLTGNSASSLPVSLIDFNNKAFTARINLAGNLTISGAGQITTQEGSSNTTNGILAFNGTNQQYSNTSSRPNGYVDFLAGNGISLTNLTLNTNLGLTRSNTIPKSSSLTVSDKATLNAGIKNIIITNDDNNIGFNDAKFNLNAGATFVTSNTGFASPDFAIEGAATSGTNGTILAGTKITKNYDAAANYVLNGATVNPFPDAITTMNKLTIGANVSLNRAIDANGTLDMASFTLTQASNNLEFNGLTSTTGKIYADKNSSLTIKGSIDTVVGTLRFVVPNGNITGQFNLDKGITVPLGSDLIIEKTPLTGNFITGNAASILDIRVNTLTINGAVSGPGFLGGSDSSNLTLGGTAGTVNFASGKRILKNLTLVNAATATLGTALNITGGTAPVNEGTVSVTGTAVLTTGGNLTLKSNINGTSRVAPGDVSGGYISGDVTVERYLFSNRAWRFVAAPTVGQTIKQSWQEGQGAGVNPGTGYGTNITSNKATYVADGYDFLTPGNSLLTYNPLLNRWEAVPSTNTAISAAGANKSYMLFSRGDRSIGVGVGIPPTEVLIRTRGTIFQGNLPAVSVPVGQYASIGNNFASAIDFTGLGLSNIDQSFSLWDPQVQGQQGLGGWVTFSQATGWMPTPLLPPGPFISYTAANTRIESGQAFMVHNSSGTSGTVAINESSKVSGSKLVARPSGNGTRQTLATNLYNINTGVARIADGNVVVFNDDYSNVIDGMDAIKVNNFGDNFGLSRDGKTLIVEARQPVVNTDTLFYNMKKIKLQSYRLEFIAQHFDANLMGFLEDSYLHISTPVNMTGRSTYDFSVTSDTASAAATRFRIVFKNSAPLPVTFSNISATEKTTGIAVEWKVENEINIGSYDVQRSVDGRNFIKVHNAVSKGETTGGTAIYNWLDIKATAGDNFYRIRSIGKDGKEAYSRIVKVTLGKVKAGFTVYPNPIADGMIGLQMKNIPAGIYTIKIINSDGQMLSKEIIKHTGGNGTQTITSASQLVSGSYQLEITGQDKTVNVLRLLVL